MSMEDYWQAGEQPLSDHVGAATGGFDYWQGGEQPPLFFDGNGNGGDVCASYPRLIIPRWEERFQKPFRQSVALAIPSGNSCSCEYLDLEYNWTVIGVYMPTAWTAANLGFYAHHPLATGGADPFSTLDGTGWESINEPDDTAYLEIQVAAGEYSYISADKLAGCRFLRVCAVTDGVLVPQDAARTVILVVRPI